MRQLTKQERAIVFDGIELRYLEAIREMEGGVAYGIPVAGTSAALVRKKLDGAAEHLGLKLRWAPTRSGMPEIFCELSED